MLMNVDLKWKRVAAILALGAMMATAAISNPAWDDASGRAEARMDADWDMGLWRGCSDFKRPTCLMTSTWGMWRGVLWLIW